VALKLVALTGDDADRVRRLQRWPALEYGCTDADGIDACFGQQLFAAGVMLEIIG
jgi:hypothetical protein